MVRTKKACITYLNDFQLECLCPKVVLETKVDFSAPLRRLPVRRVHVGQRYAPVVPETKLKKNVYTTQHRLSCECHGILKIDGHLEGG